MSSTTPNARARRTFLVAGIGIPAVLTAVVLVFLAVVAGEMPDPVATHWSISGVPNSFGSPWVVVAVTLLAGLGIPAMITANAWDGLRRGDAGPTYRLMGAVASAVTTMLTVVILASTAAQVGLADAADARLSPWVLPVSIVAALVVGFVAYRIQPEAPAHVQSTAVDPIDLSDTARAVWMHDATAARPAVVALGVAVLALAVSAVVTWLTAGASGVAWWFLGCALLILALVGATTMFHVRVDRTGLTVTSVLRLPRFHVPLEQVESVAVIHVHPMGQFGGWGLRNGPGAFGVILRTGEAIEVTRTNGRRFVVTVDDARTGAAVLRTLSERARH